MCETCILQVFYTCFTGVWITCVINWKHPTCITCNTHVAHFLMYLVMWFYHAILNKIFFAWLKLSPFCTNITQHCCPITLHYTCLPCHSLVVWQMFFSVIIVLHRQWLGDLGIRQCPYVHPSHLPVTTL